MNRWTEIRTAYEVARLGTVSAAATFLGVHRATVIRHIDTLERVLGQKLFQRHSKGYTPTEAGVDLMKVGATTDEQFNQLIGRMMEAKSEFSGNFTIATVEAAALMILPIVQLFQKKHPKIKLRCLTDTRLVKLEYGEAHLAIRAGSKPEEPDNIVQHFIDLKLGLYAHKSYVERHGIPKTREQFSQHFFIGYDNHDAAPSFFQWMYENICEDKIIFKGNSINVLEAAVAEGLGIGFMRGDVNKADFVEILPRASNWKVPLWIVTHVDLHRSEKVQAFLRLIKENREILSRTA